MDKKTVVIFGAGSDIAAELKTLLEKRYTIMSFTRRDLDLQGSDADHKIREILQTTQPDVVVNTAGVFGDNNNVDFHSIMTVNVGSNWHVVKHYLDSPPTKVVKFIMIGSSTYREGRKKYVLYAASKAALYNLWQGAREALEDSAVILGLVNPVRVNTKMVRHLSHPDPDSCLTANDVAKQIEEMIETMTESMVIDMDYKKGT